MHTSKTMNKQRNERREIGWVVSNEVIINRMGSKSWAMADGVVKRVLF